MTHFPAHIGVASKHLDGPRRCQSCGEVWPCPNWRQPALVPEPTPLRVGSVASRQAAYDAMLAVKTIDAIDDKDYEMADVVHDAVAAALTEAAPVLDGLTAALMNQLGFRRRLAYETRIVRDRDISDLLAALPAGTEEPSR